MSHALLGRGAASAVAANSDRSSSRQVGAVVLNSRPIREIQHMRRSLFIPLLLIAPALHAQGAYNITHTFPVGGNGSWDYVVPDPAHHRVFIGRSDRVMVVDETNGRLLGQVTDIHGAHGTA